MEDIIKNMDVMYVVVHKSIEFLNDAKRSVDSLKKHMPSIHSTLYTDFTLEEVGSNCFDDIINIPTPDRKNKENDIWSTKYECMLKSKFRYNLHLDADTYICSELTDLFKLVERFEFASPISIHHVSRFLPEVPSSFPEFGGGVILWQSTDKIKNLFTEVLRLIKDPNRRGCDEPSLRRAVYESDIRFAVIPWEYNCSYMHPGYLFSEVKIIHGRKKDLEKAAKIINTKVGNTVFKRVTTGGKLILIEPYGYRKFKINKEIDLS